MKVAAPRRARRPRRTPRRARCPTSPIFAFGMGTSQTKNCRPERSTVQVARASSIGSIRPGGRCRTCRQGPMRPRVPGRCRRPRSCGDRRSRRRRSPSRSGRRARASRSDRACAKGTGSAWRSGSCRYRPGRSRPRWTSLSVVRSSRPRRTGALRTTTGTTSPKFATALGDPLSSSRDAGRAGAGRGYDHPGELDATSLSWSSSTGHPFVQGDILFREGEPGPTRVPPPPRDA